MKKKKKKRQKQGTMERWLAKCLQKKQKNRKKIDRTDDSQRSHESCLKESEVDKRSDTSWMQVCKENERCPCGYIKS